MLQQFYDMQSLKACIFPIPLMGTHRNDYHKSITSAALSIYFPQYWPHSNYQKQKHQG